MGVKEWTAWRASGRSAPRDAAVLVVDDDPVIRHLIAELLEAEGYRVAEASHGADALRWLDDRRRAGLAPPEVVLLDMRMPIMNGWDFVAAYRLTPGPHARILVLTAAADAAACAAEVGADGVLAKPFDLDALLAAIETRAARSR